MVVRIFLLLIFGFFSLQAQELDYEINWEDDQAKAIRVIFPDDFKPNKNNFSIHVEGVEKSIFGKVVSRQNEIVFKPLVPFTNRLTYEVKISQKVILTFSVQSESNPPQVVNIFPKSDTLPENLLKLYILFDQSMGEGRAEENIALYRAGEEVEDAFLDLSPELWNKDNTLLTIWIDPGRVKRELERNKRLGEVIKKGSNYTLIVGNEMISKAGIQLPDSYKKEFHVIHRDESKPDVSNWKLSSPTSQSIDPLYITFDEPVDYQVIVNSIRITHEENEIAGSFEMKNDKTLNFTPTNSWATGAYALMIESRVEDLAGNNLNRLFDRDITKKPRYEEKDYFNLEFRID